MWRAQHSVRMPADHSSLLPHITAIFDPTCSKFLGFILLYFTLTAFNFMTVICVDITRMMLGYRKDSKYKQKVAVGYIVPLIITLLALIAEMSLDKCAQGRPKFGMEDCFFAGI